MKWPWPQNWMVLTQFRWPLSVLLTIGYTCDSAPMRLHCPYSKECHCREVAKAAPNTLSNCNWSCIFRIMEAHAQQMEEGLHGSGWQQLREAAVTQAFTSRPATVAVVHFFSRRT